MFFSSKLYDAYFGKAKGGSPPSPPCAVEDGEVVSAGEGYTWHEHVMTKSEIGSKAEGLTLGGHLYPHAYG